MSGINSHFMSCRQHLVQKVLKKSIKSVMYDIDKLPTLEERLD